MKIKPWHIAVAAIGAVLLSGELRRRLLDERSPDSLSPDRDGEPGRHGNRAPRSPMIGQVIEEARRITREAVT